MYLYQKTIDRLALKQGFQIPVEFHSVLQTMPGKIPAHGEIRDIEIIIEGVPYKAQLKNQDFNRGKYERHADVIQIRYNETLLIAKRFRDFFSSTWNYVESIKNLPENKCRKFVIRISEENQEYLALSTTDLKNVFVADCITTEVKLEVKNDFNHLSELDFETFETREDKNATVKEVTRMQGIRLLDCSTGDFLKLLYDYHCQMTGERIGDSYSALVVEAHHIIPFTESMNNDTSNIIILSPNYHRIIYNVKLEWDSENLAFIFPNGLVDKVKLTHPFQNN